MSQLSIFALGGQAKDGWQVPTELPSLRNVKRLALDCESDGLNPFRTNKPIGISIAYRTDKLHQHYIPFGHVSGNIEPEKVLRWAQDELRGKEIVGANIKFDIHMLREGWGLDLEAIKVKPADIAFGAALLDDQRGAGLSLDALGQKYVGESKLEMSAKKGMQHLPSWMVGPYAEQDARLTLLVDEAMRPLLKKESLERVLDVENRLIYVVCDIERNGCRIDVERLWQWQVELRAEYQISIDKIYKASGLVIQANAREDLMALCHAIGIKPPQAKTSSDQTSFTEDEILALKHPIMDEVVRLRRVDSLLSKYIDKYIEGLDGDILRSQFHQLKSGNEDKGTISGRFSSSGGGGSDAYTFNAQQVQARNEDPELQARFPIRELFIPDDGYKFFANDAKSIEYRVLAHFIEAPHILKAYADDPDADFHKIVTLLALPFLPEKYRQMPLKSARNEMKQVNFALAFGAQPEKVSMMTGMTLPETKEFLRVYSKVFPELPSFLDAMKREAKSRGFVTTMLGRRARFPGAQRLHSAVNRRVQGSAADLMKLKMLRVYDERATIGIHKLRQVVHDEQCGDMDADPKYLKLMEDCFNTQELKLNVPILWSIEQAANWGKCK